LGYILASGQQRFEFPQSCTTPPTFSAAYVLLRLCFTANPTCGISETPVENTDIVTWGVTFVDWLPSSRYVKASGQQRLGFPWSCTNPSIFNNA